MLTTEALRVKILVFNSMLLCYICPFVFLLINPPSALMFCWQVKKAKGRSRSGIQTELYPLALAGIVGKLLSKACVERCRETGV
jgi:hypothetical protein